MSGANFLKTTIMAGLARNLEAACEGSLICGGIKKSLSRAKTWIRCIFLNEITNEEESRIILCDYKVAERILNAYNSWRDKIVKGANSSVIMSWAAKTIKRPPVLTINTLCRIISIAILINIFLSVLWNREITSIGWFMKGALLCAVLCGISCRVDWKELKKTSYLIKWAERKMQ